MTIACEPFICTHTNLYNAKESRNSALNRVSTTQERNENPFCGSPWLHKRRRRLTLPTTRGKFSEVHRAPPGIRTPNGPDQATLLPIYGGSTFMLCSHVTSKKFANLAISETFNSEKKVTRRTRGWTFCFCLYNWVEKKNGEAAESLEFRKRASRKLARNGYFFFRRASSFRLKIMK